HLRERALRASRQIAMARASDPRGGRPVEQPREPVPPARPDLAEEGPQVLHVVPVIQAHYSTTTPIPDGPQQSAGRLHGGDVLLNDAERDDGLDLCLKDVLVGERLPRP